MTFSDLEVAVSQSSRKYGYIRDNLIAIWTPGAGKVQHAYSREIAGAMLLEADEFFDRALALYLLRRRLRELQASTWAGVAAYYTNYFLALSFLRLHMQSVTQLATGPTATGPIFELRTEDATPFFTIQQRGERQGHSEVWRAYYKLVAQMAWPNSATVSDIAPTIDRLRFREQLYRERINYRPGEGFDEIHLTRAPYLRILKTTLKDDGSSPLTLSDAAYTDRMAAQRLKHVAALLHRLSASRIDVDIEAFSWHRRKDMVARYASDQADRRFAGSLVSSAV